MRIALGLTPFLADFADRHGADPYWKWETIEWQAELERLAPDPATEVLWCLDGLGAEGALELWRREVIQPEATCVGWELMLFCHNPQWWERTSWWLEGEQVVNPLPEAVCV